MHWLNIFALIALGIGLVTGIGRIKSIRSQTHPQAEIAWKQTPLSPWRYESVSILALTINSLGLIGLSACLLFNVIRTKVVTFPPHPPELFILALVGIFSTSYTSGIVIAYPLIQQWIRPISYGICNDGILYGGHLISWKSCSHYEIGPADGQISLYSSYSPSLRTWEFQPPSKSLLGVLELIQKNLSRASAIDDSVSWQRSPFMLILGMIILVLGALLPAVWGWLQGLSWIWIYALAAFLLVNSLGNRLMDVYDGRGKYPEQTIQTV